MVQLLMTIHDRQLIGEGRAELVRRGPPWKYRQPTCSFLACPHKCQCYIIHQFYGRGLYQRTWEAMSSHITSFFNGLWGTCWTKARDNHFIRISIRTYEHAWPWQFKLRSLRWHWDREKVEAPSVISYLNIIFQMGIGSNWWVESNVLKCVLFEFRMQKLYGLKVCIGSDLESNNDLEVKVVDIFESMMYVKYVGIIWLPILIVSLQLIGVWLGGDPRTTPWRCMFKRDWTMSSCFYKLHWISQVMRVG